MDTLATIMEIDKDVLKQFFLRMQDHACCDHEPEPGLHMVLFAVRPLVRRGFDILVERNNKRLPTIRLPFDRLDQWQMDVLTPLNGCTISMLRERLHRRAFARSALDQHFIQQLIEAMAILGANVNHPSFDDARIVAKKFDLPSQRRSHTLGATTFIAIQLLLNAHNGYDGNSRHELIPMNFFLTLQRVPRPGTHDLSFSRKLREEFGSQRERRLTKETTNSATRLYPQTIEAKDVPEKTSIFQNIKDSPRRLFFARDPPHGSDETELADSFFASSHPRRSVRHSHPAGEGVATESNQELTKGHEETNERNEPLYKDEGCLNDEETYADLLLAITLQERRRR